MADNERALSPRAPELKTTPGGAEAGTNEVSFTTFLELLLRWLVPLGLAGLLGGVLMGGLALLKPPTYTATLTFMPQTASTQPLAGFGGAARFFGFGSASEPESPGFYSELVKTREILLEVANTEYEVTIDGEPRVGTLIELLELEPVPGMSEAAHRRMVMESIESMIETSPTMTGWVRIMVTAPWPALAEQMAARALDVLQAFNARRRTSLAAAEKEFTEQQMQQAHAELIAAEEALERFLERNRQYQRSPELVIEHGRLQRQVGYRLDVYSQLTQAFYQARIDEVRGAPKITIIEPARNSAVRNPRGVVRSAMIGGIGFAGLMLLIALGIEFLRARRRESLAAGAPLTLRTGGRRVVQSLLRFGRPPRPE